MEAELKFKLDKITDYVSKNVEKINEILSNCLIESTLSSSKFSIETFNLDPEIIQNKASNELNDMLTIDAILKYLDNGKPTQQINRLIRSESFYSSSSSLLSIESTTTTSSQDNIKEFMRQLNEAKTILESISNCPLQVPDITILTAKVTEQKSVFNDLVFSLKRLMKELISITASDKSGTEMSLPLNDNFLCTLQHLNEVSKDFFN